MNSSFWQLVLSASEIGVREGLRFSVYVVGICLVWRVARIPDLSSYAGFMIAGALAGLVHLTGIGAWAGYVLATAAGAAAGAGVFILWRRHGLNVLVVGVLISSLGFSIAAIMMGFNATLQTTELLTWTRPHPWAAATRHGLATVAILGLFGLLFQTSWGTNIYAWARSEPLGSPSWARSFRNPDFAALALGGACVGLSSFMRARDHGVFSLNEGKDLLFKALVMLVLGETLVVAGRLLLRPLTRRRALLIRRRCGFVYPLLILAAAPVGAVVFWILVNVADAILLRFSEQTGIGQYWSGLSQGMVALLAVACLLGARAIGRKEEIYEPWRFRS